MTTTPTLAIPEGLYADVETLWSYHQMHHALQPTNVGIGLGSHDPSVAEHAAELYHKGIFPLIVFTGANSPTTTARFPRGEAVHYRESAIELGVPSDAILIETEAKNTSENLTLTESLLASNGISPQSVTLISRPYQQRRAYATCRKVWPSVDVQCTSVSMSLSDYVKSIGDPKRVIDMLVGDTQRIDVYARKGFAIPQPMPDAVLDAFRRLCDAGFTSRLVTQ